MKHALSRVGRSTAGTLLVLLGVILVPLPGPGFFVIFAGLLILARDYDWAERLVDTARACAGHAGRTARHYLTRRPPTKSETRSDLVTNGDHR